MQHQLDPYVAECAAALTAAGHEVTETWTEATDPVDHNIAANVGDGSLVLVWDDKTQWVWIHYPYPHACHSDAGPLFTNTDVRPHPSEVAREVGVLIDRIIFG